MTRAKAKGKVIGKANGHITATAAARSFTVATRDVNPFEAASLGHGQPKRRQYIFPQCFARMRRNTYASRPRNGCNAHPGMSISPAPRVQRCVRGVVR